ncbi:CG15747 [Drosophila busckii]|uniref:CG15747 n=1 Tax=Drosophila busckii TaxID=30019 RepID=A0A0M3QZA0_DROBS|nr:nuclear speckle splicing regulatory protein 1 [Drosophila busckii]ALC49009.1 CG15747 [Drosophila busckii]
MSKQFGLIIPGQQKKAAARPTQSTVRPCIFDESSSSNSDDDAGPPKMRASTKPVVVSGPSLMERRKARNLQEKALAEDPTIFQYDELYDEMETKREEAKETKRQEPRKAKYIGRLMEHAERRKLENELRVERQVQKEREAEGEKFKDKETYVTSAYRKKLEAIREMQEQDKRDEYLEAIGDVTKQKDLDGFYRHIYEQKLGTQQPVLKPKTAPANEAVAYKPIKSDAATASKQRTYRKRRASEDEEQTDTATPAAAAEESKPAGSSAVKAHLTNNIDADSDFSIDSSDDEEDEKKEEGQQQQKGDKKKESADSAEAADKKVNPDTADKAKEPQKVAAVVEQKGADVQFKVPTVKEPTPPPPIDRTLIWRKRTIGQVFDEALARYQARKVARRA